MPIIRKADMENAMYEDEATPQKDEASVSATLPKSILLGQETEVGDELILRVDAVHDDSIVVSYPTKSEAESKPETAPEVMPEGEMAEEDMYA